MAQLSAWQDYAAHKLYLQQILIPLTVRNHIRILQGKIGVLALTLRLSKTLLTPRHNIIGKGIAYMKPLNQNLPLRPIEIEFENNHCSPKFEPELCHNSLRCTRPITCKNEIFCHTVPYG